MPRVQEYERPDIMLLRSIMDSANEIKVVLKVIGDERMYPANLRVLKVQGLLVSQLADELLTRFEKAGGEDGKSLRMNELA